MRNKLKITIFLLCTFGLVALGAACNYPAGCGGQIMYGATTEQVIEAGDETTITTTSINFTIDEGEDLGFEIPCDEVDQIVSRDVRVQEVATANFVDIEEEFYDNGDGICGFNYSPLDGGDRGWLGEPLACNHLLLTAEIEMRTSYVPTNASKLDDSQLADRVTFTASREFHTPCSYSVDIDDALGAWRGMAIGGDDTVGRLYITSDLSSIDNYAKFLEGFDSRSQSLSRLSTRLKSSDDTIQSVKLMVDKDTGIMIDMTYETSTQNCYVKAYESVTGSSIWSKTFADDSVDSYRCLDATIGGVAILEELDMMDWPNPRYAVRILDIFTGNEIDRYMIDPAEFGMVNISKIEHGLDDTYLVLANDGDFNSLMRVTLGDTVVMQVFATDTDYTEIQDILSDDAENVIYTFEYVYKESCSCIVATVFKRSANGDVLVGFELEDADDLGDLGDLFAFKMALVGDHIYAIANGSGFGVVEKIYTKNMTAVWKRYAMATIYDLKVDETSGDVVMRGDKIDGRVVTPAVFRVSVYGTHFGDVFFDNLYTMAAALLGDLFECPPGAELCDGPLTHL